MARFGNRQLRWSALINNQTGIVHAVEEISKAPLGQHAFIAIGCRTDSFTASRAANIGLGCHQERAIARKIAVFESVERYCCHRNNDHLYWGYHFDPTSILQVTTEYTGADSVGSDHKSHYIDDEASSKTDNYDVALLASSRDCGSAAASTVRNALRNAFEELIEREVISLSWFTRKAVGVRGVSWTEKPCRADPSLYTFVLLGQAFNTMIVTCFGKGEWPKLAYGFGTGPTIAEAAYKAKREYVLTRAVLSKLRETDEFGLIPDRLHYYSDNVDG
jgi:hypothetical protein